MTDTNFINLKYEISNFQITNKSQFQILKNKKSDKTMPEISLRL